LNATPSRPKVDAKYLKKHDRGQVIQDERPADIQAEKFSLEAFKAPAQDRGACPRRGSSLQTGI
jgi:hypothetical protein